MASLVVRIPRRELPANDDSRAEPIVALCDVSGSMTVYAQVFDGKTSQFWRGDELLSSFPGKSEQFAVIGSDPLYA